MKQVLVDLGKLKSLYSGLGQVSAQYGKNLILQKPPDMDFMYLLPRQYKSYFGSSVNYTYLNSIKRYFPSSNKKFDLWHAIHQDSAFLPGSTTPYLLTIHDLNFLREKSASKSQMRLKKLQAKVDRANAVVFISHFTETEAKSNLDIHVPASVIYNGVEISKTEAVKPAFIPVNCKNFLFSAGVILEKKNFHVLVDFMSLFEDTILIIAGDKSGSYANFIQDKVTEKKLNKKIILPGIVSDREKIWLYQNCKAFLFPSKNEGFGLPVIEAMSFGKPVFVSNLTSLPEIAADAGFYWKDFNPVEMTKVFHQNMKSAMSDENVNKRIDRAKFFSWEKNVSEYIKLYRSLMK